MAADTKTVDVLAAVDSLYEEYEYAAEYMGEGCIGIDPVITQRKNEVRAAIAELIEADKEYDAAHARANGMADKHLSSEKLHAITQRVANAEKRRAAALRACETPSSYPTPSESVGNAASVEGGA